MKKKNYRSLPDRRELQNVRDRGRTSSLWSAITITSCLVALVAAGLLSTRTPKATAAAQMINGISREAMDQIEALIREKDGRRGVELKIDSQLIYELKMSRGQAVAEGVQRVETYIEYDNQGNVVLDVKADISSPLMAQLRGRGALLVTPVAPGRHLRILARIDQVESIAALPGVEFIQPKQGAMTAGIAAPQRGGGTPRYQSPGGESPVVDDVSHGSSRRITSPGFLSRAAEVQDYISAALNGAQPNVQGTFSTFTGVGSRSSEGDITHRANTARGTFHVDGTGIKIGVLSDGITNLAASQALGDLGPVTVLPGQAGSGDEGTAMLEIIHDLAPGAQLFFATAFSGITNFAQNIRNLRAAGCDIIVDDVFYYVETPFQDGQAPAIVSNTNGGAVIQAVNDVTAAGALYFSSAGNSGNLTDGTAGVWEGDFADGGATGSPIPAGSAGNFHNFGGQNFNTLTLANTSAPIGLYWSDPLGGSSNDYDLFRLNAAGTAIAASSTNIQNGTQDPYEQISQSTANPRIVIVKKTGAADRFLHLNANRGRFSIRTSGQTHGHSHAADAFSCAATPAVGPFPNPHSGANVTETFTSDGPRRIFYQADGTPFTPGNFSSTGGILRQKPDITAADGVMVTGVGGFPSPFFGTSASAPHAAAIASLLKSANPAFTPAQIRTALTSTAIDIEAPGVDRDTGAGIITAFGAMQALGVPGTAFLEFVSITANEDPGNGNGQLDAGEGANLSIQLKNSGVVDATLVSATLTTSTPGITIHSPNISAYPDLAALGGTGTNTTLYRFTIASNVTCPTTISFTLTATFTGGGSPQVLNFMVLVGPPAISISSTLDATPPVGGTGFTALTGNNQNARISRDGIASTCAAPKAMFPGSTAPGNRTFDAYSFTTCSNSGSSCVTVTLSGTNAVNLFTAAYNASYDPLNIATNYLADPGSSAASRTYSFNMPAGVQTFVIVVHEVNPGGAIGTAYNLSVSGSCVGACVTPNHVPVAICQNVTVAAGASCTANASIDNGSFDPDGGTPTITQTPPGPYPLGMTSVLLTVTDQAGATSQCTATVTVVDSTPPSIGPCPANVAQSAAATCPASTSTVVNYPTPPATDNCGISSVVCTPPSGSSFPVGTTTVTCTATDNSGNTATCSFTVSIFNVCLQDETKPNTVLLINTATGAYKFCCGGTTFTGTGTIIVRGCTISLQHSAATWRVNASIDQTQFKGTASLQSPPGTLKCTIIDKDTRNNSCNCQ